MITQDKITELVVDSLPKLPLHLRDWAKAHLCAPRLVQARVSPFEPGLSCVWLLTDDIGVEDSSDRIVFDVGANAFGRLTTLVDGVIWYQGPEEADFAEMVKRL